MKRLNLLYLAGVLVIAIGFFASPTPGWAAYLDNKPDITTGGLNQPAKVAVDSANGDVYVTDAGNKMVKKYDKTGVYLSGFSVSGTPVGIAVTSSNILVGDSTNHCVWVFSKSGVLSDLYYTGTTHKIDGLGTHSTIGMPNTVAVAPAGHIFVLDGDNDKGYVYSSGGKYLAGFGIGGSAGSTTNIQFYNPTGIAFGTSTPNSPSAGLTTQNFYVGDQGNNRVLKLSYVYNTTQFFITANSITLPGSSPTFGTKGDAFNKFLRISDLAWDNNNRLLVLDSLQQVAQVFSSTGGNINTMVLAANYSGTAVLNQLNIPTGAAVDLTAHKLYVTNNQAGSLSVYDTTDGTLPTISITDPSTPNTSGCVATYPVAFSGTAATGSVTVNLYYAKIKDASGNNIANPVYKLFSTQPKTVSGTFSGTAPLDLVGTSLSNFMWSGTYGLYAEVIDSNGAFASTTKPSSGTILVSIIAGKRRYTCAMQAKFGTTFDISTQDTDNDGLTDFDELEGTYNSAYGYAPTDPYVADSDGDGLDDGVEELQRTLANNISMPLTGGLMAAATNPNNADTDGGGVSDGVEIAKGTSPTAGADDLSSTQDLVADYFLDAAHGADTPQNQCTWFDITNPTSSNAVVDLAFYNLNGTINSKVPAAYKLAPNQSVRFFPKKTYGINEGSLEIRANTGSVKADMVRYRENWVDVNSIDSGGAINLWRPADKATRLMSPIYADGGWRFRSWVYVKNWSDTPAHITAKFYDYNPANPASPQSVVFPTNYYNSTTHTVMSDGPSSYILGGHESVVISPLAVYGDTPDGSGNASMGAPGHYGQGYLEVNSDNATVTANLYCDRMTAGYYNPASAFYQAFDYSFLIPLVNNTAATSYFPMLVTEIFRYKPFIYIGNPNAVQMNGNIKFYNTQGTNVLTRNFSVPPYAGKAYSTVGNVDMGDGSGAQPMLTPGSPPDTSSTLYDQGQFIITTDQPHVAGTLTQRWNPTGFNGSVGQWFDYGWYNNTITSITNTPYVSSYFDNSEMQRLGQANTTNADGRLTAFGYLTNFSDTNTCTVATTYYDSSGSPAKTGSINSGTTSLTMNTTSGIRIAASPVPASTISIAGVTGVKTVTAVNGNTVTIDTPADATVTNAVVSIVRQVGPHKLLTFQPNSTGASATNTGDGCPTMGSIKLVSDNPLAGYQLGQEYNYTSTSTSNMFFDFGFAKPFWSAP